MNDTSELEALEDARLTAMLRHLAALQEDAEIKQLLSEPVPLPSPDEEAALRRIYVIAGQQLIQEQKKLRKRQKRTAIRRTVKRLVNAAAMVSLILTLITVAGFTFSPSFRAAVTNLMVEAAARDQQTPLHAQQQEQPSQAPIFRNYDSWPAFLLEELGILEEGKPFPDLG